MKQFILIGILAYGALIAWGVTTSSRGMEVSATIMSEKPTSEYPVATLAGGCFWCIESEFRALDGVVYTVSGYTGGALDNPTYQDITTGKTGHAEAIDVYYDPKIISYEDLLEFFLTKAHDPTQLNRQGVDKGTQYRSAIFYKDEAEKAAAEAKIADVTARKVWKDKIVTTSEPAATFWPAEEYHQQYYEKYEQANGRPHIRVMMKQRGKK